MYKNIGILNGFFLIFSIAVYAQSASIIKSTDVILGKDGVLTGIEYASLSCGGCAYFAKKILPDIEKEFIQTGKMRLIIRQMVMNENDMKASMLVCCHPNPHKLQMAYWSRQPEWTGTSEEGPIRKIAQEHGMTPTQINACWTDAHLRQTLYSKKFIALKGYNIKSIPTFFINNKEYPDIQSTADLRKVIEQALKEDHTKSNK